MSSDPHIRHIIPQVGTVGITLFPPADLLYDKLIETKEIRRLNKLRHLGSLSYLKQGARQARWDYTVAMLHYIDMLQLSGLSTGFKIGSIEFSSAKAALQSIALIWNLGHLPGTFATEKGLIRFLYAKNRSSPAHVFNWPHIYLSSVKHIRKEATRVLQEYDYIALSKVLAIIKLFSFAETPTDFIFHFTSYFAAPFLLSYEPNTSQQWSKLRKAHRIVRHLAYLTIDSPLTGIRCIPSIPTLFDDLLKTADGDLEILANHTSEILSPFERLTYARLYHCEEARKDASLLAKHVEEYLSSSGSFNTIIDSWLRAGLFRELGLGKKPYRKTIKIGASVPLRSHFVGVDVSPTELEASLNKKGFYLSAIFYYQAWNSHTLIEPDELIIDIMSSDTPSTLDIGKFLGWFIANFDNLNAKPDDLFDILKKVEIAEAYAKLLGRAISIAFPLVTVNLKPWRLSQFGILADTLPEYSSCGIWAAKATLDDPITRHIIWDRSKSIPAHLKDNYEEILGIKALRKRLLKQCRGRHLRHKFLVVTGSVKFRGRTRDLMEYDGGILKIAPRGGKLTWYGLESKRGSEDPATCLKKKLRRVRISAPVTQLSSNHAFVELTL